MDEEERKRILESCHKHPMSGHMGSKKTLARITERFIWPGVTKDVYHLVSVMKNSVFACINFYLSCKKVETCDECQRTGRKMSKAAPELHPVPVVSPWYHVGIDFIGPLTPASQGCSYILTISDYFSKFVQAYAMETKHASGVAAALFKVVHIILFIFLLLNIFFIY